MWNIFGGRVTDTISASLSCTFNVTVSRETTGTPDLFDVVLSMLRTGIRGIRYLFGR